VIVNVAALDILRGSHSALTRERRRYTKRRLHSLLSDAGFLVERLSFTNLSPFPFALAVRLLERATGRADTASTADLRVPMAPINALFDGLLALEAAWLRVGNLPIGSSILAMGRKRPD
jgi:hypothetical protein